MTHDPKDSSGTAITPVNTPFIKRCDCAMHEAPTTVHLVGDDSIGECLRCGATWNPAHDGEDTAWYHRLVKHALEQRPYGWSVEYRLNFKTDTRP